ncbi:MAG: hypothetical protein HY646_21195 [Acidobacteria bacterium]|nr:hypothetical protein [Acidobacteriota bacterium]
MINVQVVQERLAKLHRGLVDFERFAEHLSDWLDKQGLSNPHGDKP